jgi:ribosomal protein L16 Arg81 hydroxylase
MPIAEFGDVVASIPVDEFLRSYGNDFKHIPGDAGKFDGLLPWAQINLILRQHRLDHPRLRLALEGEIPSREAVLDHPRSRFGTETPRLRSADLVDHIRRGATLVIDAVDETYEPLATLADSFERIFREHVQVNAYFGWGTTHGFDLHWDDHDVFALQIVGRKRWSIYGPSRLYPLVRDIEPNEEPPSEAMWEGTLESGDLLYVPRGWWHIAAAIGEPTGHLTFGVANRTGVDLLDHVRDRLRGSEQFRKDLPRFTSPSEQRAHAAALRDEILRLWDSEVMAEYFDHYDGMARPRPAVSLPWSVTADGLPESDDAQVCLTAVRTGVPRLDEQTFSFAANGRTWTFVRPVQSLLAPLLNGETRTVAELLAEASDIDPAAGRQLLGDLVIRGLLSVSG